MQVLLATVLVDALHAALKDAVEALNCVRVDFRVQIIHILARAVVGPTVGVKHLTSTDALILLGFVGHDIGLTGDVLLQNRDNLVEKHLTFRLV
jgi:hypothetical protein